MYKYVMQHEEFITHAMKNNTYDKDWLINYHLTKIQFIQHERLIHLIITLFFAILTITSTICSICYYNPLLFLLDLILFILLGFYIRHYYRLENTLAHWYKIYDLLKDIKLN